MTSTPLSSHPLSGRCALVTGAARGIGRAIAQGFAQAGADVALLDVPSTDVLTSTTGYQLATPADLEAAAAATSAHGQRVRTIAADVRDLDAMSTAVDEAVDSFGRLDIVVANAGYVAWTPFAEGTSEQWRDVFDVNVHGTFNTFRASIDALRESDAGRMIAMSSIGGRQGVVGNGPYCATKWAVIGMVKQAALELGPDGITVNAIAPGPVDTAMYRSEGQHASMGVSNDDEQDQMIRPALPLGDRASLAPSDIADAAVFLAGPGAATISGICLDVALGYNAGYTA